MTPVDQIPGIVSVIVPAYDAIDTIDTAIESALAQSVPERWRREIIVIDDGSPTDLRPALAKYGTQVRCVRQANAGAAAARNHGIELATGEHLAFLDADDTWEPRKLQRQIELLESHKSIGLVASRYYTQAPKSRQRVVQAIEEHWLDRTLRVHGEDLFTLASVIWTGTVMVRRSALGDDRFTSGLEPAEDRDLWLRIIQRTAALVQSEPLATAVLVPGSLSRRDPDSGYEPMIRVLQRHADLVPSRTFRRLEARVYRSWAGSYLAERHAHRALKFAIKRLQAEPYSLEAWWIVGKCAALAPVDRRRRASCGEDRSESALRRHYQVECDLASRLRNADPLTRRSLYGQVYDELFRRVHDHPQNVRKSSAGAQQAASDWQWRLLKNFVNEESRYLEIGAGDCHLAMQVARHSRWAYGVDVSNFIAANGSRPDNFSLLISDGVQLNVPPGSIDIAYSNQLMEHLHPDDAAAQVAQIRRSLCPGGKYVCVTPHRFSGPHDISRFFTDEASGFHLKEYTYEELRDLLLSAGFTSVEVWSGVKGRFFKVPLMFVLAAERLLSFVPRPLRSALASIPPLRTMFVNVLLVGCVADGARETESLPAGGPVTQV